jgi:hypothetical protein
VVALPLAFCGLQVDGHGAAADGLRAEVGGVVLAVDSGDEGGLLAHQVAPVNALHRVHNTQNSHQQAYTGGNQDEATRRNLVVPVSALTVVSASTALWQHAIPKES